MSVQVRGGFGFAWIDDIHAYVRVSDLVNRADTYLVEVKAEPRGQLDVAFMIGDPLAVKLSEIIRRTLGGDTSVTRVKQSCRFLINGDGEFLRWLPPHG